MELQNKLIKSYTYQPPHGYFKGQIKSNICPCIDASIAYWHTLILEEYEDDDDKERDKYGRSSTDC